MPLFADCLWYLESAVLLDRCIGKCCFTSVTVCDNIISEYIVYREYVAHWLNSRSIKLLKLIDIIKQAGAELEGVGIAIEKGFQPGRKVLEEKGARVESLAIIEKMGNGSITFKEQDN